MTDEEFASDFPVDFGRGIRGYFINDKGKPAGVIVCHREDNVGCAVSAFWTKIGTRPQVGLIKSDPLTLEDHIRCDCGLHGWIREGRWEYAHDSVL
jgi:hypothetical protein